jgi:hypothetical protein
MNMKGKILNNRETKEPRSIATHGTDFTEGIKIMIMIMSKMGKKTRGAMLRATGLAVFGACQKAENTMQ